MEQSKLEMQKTYENKIQGQIESNESKIKNLLGSFKKDLNKVQNEYEECKRTAGAHKDIKETNLDKKENDHEDHFNENEVFHMTKVKDLDTVWDDLK
jgi:uncharacterized protein (DUF111 family)